MLALETVVVFGGEGKRNSEEKGGIRKSREEFGGAGGGIRGAGGQSNASS